MPSASEPFALQTEKPQHYLYLKDFRTQQCELFLQHKCQQHRPFTCFHWHFVNQRRRRPYRKRDGTFSYSPDIYCTKYDETTGICPDGDECPFLHRTAGDTERRYHLRYYKTGTCVYETDAKGHCTKNGPHCAFAHGVQDVRPPIFDSAELQSAVELIDKSFLSLAIQEKDRALLEDPRWNDASFVLANYKTEPCKRPPRLCRQGYACPQFHNVRDRRRGPQLFKYRSTPCPSVKHGDEWGDPTQCESGDNCSYCHTRTEQQFHPEIYKSTKCNDMVQTNSCPRGAFCAFAHVEQEIASVRDVVSSLSHNSLAAFVTSILPASEVSNSADQLSSHTSDLQNRKSNDNKPTDSKLPDPIGKERSNSISFQPGLLPISLLTNNSGSNYGNTAADPFSRTRSSSVSSEHSSSPLYMRAPGFEREEIQLRLRHQLAAVETDTCLDQTEKSKLKENLILSHLIGLSSQLSNSWPHSQFSSATSISPQTSTFFPSNNCVDSVLGCGFADILLDSRNTGYFDRELNPDLNSNLASSCHATDFGGSASGFQRGNSSMPISIPPVGQRGSLSSMSQSPSSPFGSFPLGVQLQRQDYHEISSSPLLNNYTAANKGQLGSNSTSPRSTGPHSPMLSGSFTSLLQNGEVMKLREELATAKSKMSEWEGVYNQAKCACEAWKKEADEANRKAKAAEEDKILALKQKEEIQNQNAQVQQILAMSGGPHIQALSRRNELFTLSIQQLQVLRLQLQKDVHTLDTLINQKMQRKV